MSARNNSFLKRIFTTATLICLLWQLLLYPMGTPITIAGEEMVLVLGKATEALSAYWFSHTDNRSDVYVTNQPQQHTFSPQTINTLVQAHPEEKSDDDRQVIAAIIRKTIPRIPKKNSLNPFGEQEQPHISADAQQVSIALPEVRSEVRQRQQAAIEHISVCTPVAADSAWRALEAANPVGKSLPAPERSSFADHISTRVRVIIDERIITPEEMRQAIQEAIRAKMLADPEVQQRILQQQERNEEQCARRENWEAMLICASRCDFTSAQRIAAAPTNDRQREWCKEYLQAVFTEDGVVRLFSTYDPLWKEIEQNPSMRRAYTNNIKKLANGKTALETFNNVLKQRYVLMLRMAYVYVLGHNFPHTDAEEQDFFRSIPKIEKHLFLLLQQGYFPETLIGKPSVAILYELINDCPSPLAQHKFLLSGVLGERKPVETGSNWYIPFEQATDKSAQDSNFSDFITAGILNHFTNQRAQALRQLYATNFCDTKNVDFKYWFIYQANQLLFLDQYLTIPDQRAELDKAFALFTEAFTTKDPKQREELTLQAGIISVGLFDSPFFTNIPVDKALLNARINESCQFAIEQLHLQPRYSSFNKLNGNYFKFFGSLWPKLRLSLDWHKHPTPIRILCNACLQQLYTFDGNPTAIHAGILAVLAMNSVEQGEPGTALNVTERKRPRAIALALAHGICRALQNHDEFQFILQCPTLLNSAFQLLLVKSERPPQANRGGNEIAFQNACEIGGRVTQYEEASLASNEFYPGNFFQKYLLELDGEIIAAAAARAHERETSMRTLSQRKLAQQADDEKESEPSIATPNDEHYFPVRWAIAARDYLLGKPSGDTNPKPQGQQPVQAMPPMLDPNDPEWRKKVHQDVGSGDKEKLRAAIKLFSNSPGTTNKNGPITRVLKFGSIHAEPGQTATAKGAAFELEKAYDLIQTGKITEVTMKLGEQVLATLENGSKISAEFDIVTLEELMECKNVNWETQDIEALKRQFGTQNRIAKRIGKSFVVFSKNQIPTSMKQWFLDNGIKWFEG